ncbi:hypothetical protein Pst134EA_031971 [Puccinia striiformis f. sp. tritici]|uniref:uncharacterized protein n=1 Tax=Puccinia striiformis f. sp. tritici TaxID=168172 RepID=UPI0020084756|nr:uncharacterized protein Pst134EA_031971 [Puccinia striiformis f. sp. tritici]KAH9442552.1 hypothetical protein Pst134EA_031971 [Puccinia striiformis f. sp. tritici]
MFWLFTANVGCIGDPISGIQCALDVSDSPTAPAGAGLGEQVRQSMEVEEGGALDHCTANDNMNCRMISALRRCQSGRVTRRTFCSSDRVQKNGPTGIVFMNMGGPRTVSETGDFLSRLFHDGDLIPLPFQSTLAPFIAKRRTPKIEKQYADIGGGSPILKWTQEQASGMVKILDELSPATAPHRPYVAFRYAHPLTETCLDEMKRDGVSRAVAFSQYPQYSCSTTGSSLNELYRHLIKNSKDGPSPIKWSVIDRWPTHPGLIEAFAVHVERALESYDPLVRSKVILLFSAHSLPMSVVNRGDTYPSEVAATVHAVMKRLNYQNPYRLVWQSYAKKGVNDMLLIPIAFTSDHIETLFELDLEYIQDAKEAGLTGVKRVESLNADPIFVRALADIAATHLKTADSNPTSTQMTLRCPGCINNTCLKSKEYFSQREIS